ncbi:MAG: carboxypeptidase M32 [Fimbriimonadales bacterium]|nr:carboxypeptidase M32 [Fimbriimonadales bacterium]
MSTAMERLKKRLTDLRALEAAMGLMGWDQQCYMPKGGAEARALHLSTLSRMHHELFACSEMGDLLAEAAAEAEPGSLDAAMVRVVRRDYDKATKLPPELVEEQARLSAEGHEVWVEARRNDDFASFAPILRRVFELNKRIADCLGYEEHIYDALLDLYEEGATRNDCLRMYEALKQETVPLVRSIAERPQNDDSFLHGEWDVEKQREFTLRLVRAIGFDLERGRQDVAPHPFCTGWSVNDIRLTTRFTSYLPSAIFGSLHEAGHGLYEQNSPKEWDQTPLAGGVSMALHESQSRTWENLVGRSRAFWARFLPDLQQAFPQLAGVDVDAFYKAVNRVQPSLIRVEADEVTYNLHTLVRFEIECEVLTDQLAVDDIPEAWNAKYEAYLGVRPPNDANGCLQDVHWSGGMVGYFPTYTMGNILSFQFWELLAKDLGDPYALISRGEFAPLLDWLREKIYSQGKRYTPKELVRRVTGGELDPKPYLAGLKRKYAEIYGL